MRRVLGVLAAALAAAFSLAFARAREPIQVAPTLAVFIEVDQLRGDLLERYDRLFTGGFRRLLDDGYRFTQASHRHAATETAVGHATLSTGVFPSRHGIVANSWDEERGDRWAAMYSFGDDSVDIVGRPDAPGRSPRNLLRDGLADWIVRRDPRARVVAVAGKDRSAIALAGRVKGHVYWLDGGELVTSTWYRDALPDWVRDVNRTGIAPIYAGFTEWSARASPEAARLARPDTAAYEGDGIHTSFPHRFADEGEGDSWSARIEWVNGTPAPDAGLGLFAEVALRELRLGRNEWVDFLSVSFSQTDLVGHDYGPLSREQLENLLQLDRTLGRLLVALDREVGSGRWVLALSADHGTMTEAEWRVAQGEPGARLTAAELARVRAVQATPPADAAAAVAGLEALRAVAAVYPVADLQRGVEKDSFAVLFRNSLSPGRAAGALGRAGLRLRPEEGTVWSTAATGSTHGTPYWYDRWVPLVFLGGGVEPGMSRAPVYTVDAAPTLARLVGVTPPQDLDGKPILP